jgi:hypothetical protein
MNFIFSINILRKASLLSVVVLSLTNCKKEDNFIGSELQKEDLGVNKLSNFSIVTYTKEADSLRADELSTATLGSMNDPDVGKTESSFYTQLRLPVDNVDFAGSGSLTDIVLDSVVLSLEYKDYYGSLDPQNFEVMEVTEDFYLDSAYYNGKSFATNPTNLVVPGSRTQIPDPTSSVFTATDSFPAQLRLKLDNSFGQKIIDESGNSTLSDNQNFLQFLKGIEVKVNNPGQASNQGAILLLDLISLNSSVTLYYRDTASKDTLTFNLLMNTNCARVNKNVHDYSGTLIPSQLADSTLGSSVVFVQGLDGLKTEIEFTDVMKLKDSNIIINKAVLKMPVDNTAGNDFEPIEQLLIVRNENNLKYLLLDQTMFAGQVGLDNVGGQWNEDDSQYEFVITRYLNNLLNGNFPNNRLTLETISAMVTPNRSVFYGHNSAVRKPELTITYTKY